MTRLKMSRTIRKERILAFAATCMELELILLSEVSEGEGQTPSEVAYVWNLKHGTQCLYEATYKSSRLSTQHDVVKNSNIMSHGRSLGAGKTLTI